MMSHLLAFVLSMLAILVGAYVGVMLHPTITNLTGGKI